MNALSLITSLGKEGKTPLEIARELHARGLTNDNGKVISPEMVAGFLRFVGVAEGSALPEMERMENAAWGSGRKQATAADLSGSDITGDSGRRTAKKRKSSWSPQKLFNEEQKAEIMRLYKTEAMKPADIAQKLGLIPRRVYAFCMYLAGFSVPPGEIEEVIDEQGRRIIKCPPGYARGFVPQRNVRPTQGGW